MPNRADTTAFFQERALDVPGAAFPALLILIVPGEGPGNTSHIRESSKCFHYRFDFAQGATHVRLTGTPRLEWL
jgi:hypothetical protein